MVFSNRFFDGLGRIAMAVTFTATVMVSLGCNQESTSSGTVAATCVESDLLDQCPPNTVGELIAESESVCEASTTLRGNTVTSEAGGEINAICQGSGSCRVVCRFDNPCQFGVVEVSPSEGVICYIPDGGCGDGACQPGETPTNCPEDCANECEPNSSRCSEGKLERCNGNGRREASIACGLTERCEAIADSEPPSAHCVSTCGDGVVQPPEGCDDANEIDDDACSNDCIPATCGDGQRQDDEECDDGNRETEVCDYGLESCDVCSATCQLISGETALCGDGLLQSQETCDDGNTVAESCSYGEMSCEVCSDRCALVPGEVSFCGDGTQTAVDGEACDDGGQNANDSACLSSCQTARCGDGFTRLDITDASDEDFEYCDDGNDVFFDGCSGNCQFAEQYDPLQGESCVGIGSNCDPDGAQPTFDDDDGSCVLPSLGVGNDPECIVKNDWPLRADPNTGLRSGMIHGRLISGSGKVDFDQYVFDALCGFASVADCPDCNCSGTASSFFRIVIDFKRDEQYRPAEYYDASNRTIDQPFSMIQQCNRSCVRDISADPASGFCRRDQLYDTVNWGNDCRDLGCSRGKVCRFNSLSGYACVSSALDDCGSRGCGTNAWCRLTEQGRYACQPKTIRNICHPSVVSEDVERAYHCLKADSVGTYRFSVAFNGASPEVYPIEYTLYIEEVVGEDDCDWPQTAAPVRTRP